MLLVHCLLGSRKHVCNVSRLLGGQLQRVSGLLTVSRFELGIVQSGCLLSGHYFTKVAVERRSWRFSSKFLVNLLPRAALVDIRAACKR